jgi:sigma-B regulation protein RsbU (phosphoserine phosphatase)
MRVSIRWKLMMAIGFPLMAVYVVIFIADYHDQRQIAFERVASKLTAVVQTNATRLDNQIERVEQCARTVALMLDESVELSDPQIETALLQIVGHEPMITAATVVFPASPDRPLRAVSAATQGGEPARLIDRVAADPKLVNRTWYIAAKRFDGGLWDEPTRDSLLSGTSISTFAMPVMRDDQLFAVVAMDLPLGSLQQHINRRNLEVAELYLASRSGVIISHEVEQEIMEATLFSFATLEAHGAVSELTAAAGTGQSGVRRIVGFPSSGAHLIFFAPMQSTGWSFIAAAPEKWIMAPVYDQLKRRPLVLLAGLLAILGVIFVASMRITQPVLQLADGVRKLSGGNLDASVDTVDTRDELGELSNAFNRMVVDLKDHIAQLQKATADKERVASELRVGRDIQTSLLPHVFPTHDQFDLTAVNIPAKEIAGDFYDFFFAREGVLTIVVADVSGKGVPAALFMAVSRTVIRNLALTGLEPDQIMMRANETLIADNEKGLFLTIWIGQYNVHTGELTYANCGHPPPFMLAADGEVTVFGEVTGPLLGIVEPELFGIVEQKTVHVELGDTLLLYTDGIPEAIAPDGEFLGDARFQRLIADLHGETVQRICTLAIDQIDAFVANEANDDRTLLVLQRRM